jgi:hypothetical protein
MYFLLFTASYAIMRKLRFGFIQCFTIMWWEEFIRRIGETPGCAMELWRWISDSSAWARKACAYPFIIDKVQDGKNSHLVFIAERSGHFS